MVKANSLDMSLSDIIKTKKTAKKGIRKVGALKKKGAAATSGGTPRRQSGGIRKKVVRKPAPAPSPAVEKNRTVRINVSNLAHSVVSNDLRELFAEFHLRSVAVNFNERGDHLGTGDLTLSKVNADRLIKKYAGVAVDGRIMQFAVIESANFLNRTSTPQKRRSDAVKQPTRKPVGNKKGAKPAGAAGGAGAAKKTKKPKREPKVQKTAEELDAELDAYMSRSG